MKDVEAQPGLPPKWVPDSEAPACAVCAMAFNVVMRRHHCRACGAVVCAACSPHKLRLPDFSLHTLQRVCTRCHKEHNLEVEWEKETETAQCYLAMLPAGFSLAAPLFQCSRRDVREKSLFLVTETASSREFLLTSVVPGRACPVQYASSEPSRLALQRILISGLHHPYLWPITAAAFLEGRQRALVLAPWCARGSLRDLIHRANPKAVYGNKYGDAGTVHIGKPLCSKEVALYGRQVLEAMAYLKTRGLRTLHLHAGNVLVRDGTCYLTDVVVNELLALTPAGPQQRAGAGGSNPTKPSPSNASNNANSLAPKTGSNGTKGEQKENKSSGKSYGRGGRHKQADPNSSTQASKSSTGSSIQERMGDGQEVLAFGRLLYEMVLGQPLPSNELPKPLPRPAPAPFGEVLQGIFYPAKGQTPSLEDLMGHEVFARVQLLADVGYIHQTTFDSHCIRLLEQVMAASAQN